MKVSFNPKQCNRVDFRGHDVERNDRGRNIHQFYYPYDEDNFDCELEVFGVETSENGDFIVNHKPLKNQKTGGYSTNMHPGANRVDIASNYLIADDEPFAYHFKLKEKNTPEKKQYYRVDVGTVVDNSWEGANKIYNISNPDGSRVTKGGSMLLTMADFHNPMWVYDEDNNIVKNKNVQKSLDTVKTFSNKVGGSLAGIEKSLELGEFKPYSRIITTPFQSGDGITSHGYWITNAMQMALPQGNLNNYSSLVRKLFAKGKNIVSDAALVNEGLEGVHFQKVAKYGLDSEFAGWFRIQALQDGPLFYGVFSKKKDFISARIVNSKYEYKLNEDGTYDISVNKKYNFRKPTYIQVYDNRIVDKTKLDSSKPIEEYDYKNAKNKLEIGTSNDTIIPYKFEIRPETVNDNVKRLNEYNKLVGKDNAISMESYKGARFLTQADNYSVEERFESGFDTWDSNADIPRIDYRYSSTDTENLKNVHPSIRNKIMAKKEQSRAMARDYAVAAGQYWTAYTRDAITRGIVSNFKDVDYSNPKAVYEKINKLIESGKLPKNLKMKIDEDLITKVLNGKYRTNNTKDTNPYRVQIIGNMMNLPLDSIEFGDDIVGTFATSYMSKRASSDDYIGVSRYKLWENGNPHLTAENKELYTKMNSVYENQMYEFARDVLDKVEEKIGDEGKLHDKYGNTTKFGKVVLPIYAKDIAKFAVIKGLYPQAKVEYNSKTGEISYDYKKLKEVSLGDVGVFANSEKDEARELITKLKHGIATISENDKDALASAIVKGLNHLDYNAFNLADVIIDKTNAGLDWRIDAAKDVADVEALRAGGTEFETLWDDVIGFWKSFADGILKENKNSYLVAEITNEDELYDRGWGGLSKRFSGKADTISKFLRETGITAIADYKWFYSTTAQIFAKSAEDAASQKYNDILSLVFNQCVGGGNFFRSGDIKSILYAYNFVDNHDKPRILDSLATDNELFYADLLDRDNWSNREKAYRILNDIMIGDIIPRYYNEDLKKYQDRVNKFITEHEDFERVSSKACARGRTLNSGFGRAIAELYPANENYDRNQEIVKAINPAITDLVKGSYLGKNIEADTFGAKGYDICVDCVIEQAKFKHGLKLSKDEEKKLKDKAFENIISPQISKFKAIMQILAGVPGIPTLYFGDDVGVTGYEQKTKNIYQANRAPVHREWLDSSGESYKKFIDDAHKDIAKIMSLRAKPECHAMNDGTPYMLMEHEVNAASDPARKGYKSKVDAILRHAKDGSMTITMFNLRGAKHDDDTYLGIEEGYKPVPVTLDKLYLNEGGSILHGIKGGIRQGLKFVNAEDENDVYYVRESDNGQNHYLVKHVDGYDVPIYIKGTTLTLYHVPDNNNANLSFTGKKVLYNPQYHFVSRNTNPYAVKEEIPVGKSLAVTSK